MQSAAATHLSDAAALNSMVTTITSQVKMLPPSEEIMDDINAHQVYAAVQEVVRRNGYIVNNKRQFKNCLIFGMRVKSNRGGCRRISVKVFCNLTLHIVGAHSVEMIDRIAAKVTRETADELGIPLTHSHASVSMVNYSYSLPGPVRLRALCRHLIQEHKLLVFFDPAKYAGVTVKVKLLGVMCSLMVFESRKVIISTPKCESRDELLSEIVRFIETAVVRHWVAVCMH